MEQERAEAKRCNQIKLRGYAGRDAEVSQTATGKTRASFTMNTGGGMKGSRERREDSIYPPPKYPDEWHYVIAWGLLAASCDAVKKGAHLEVHGRLTYYKDPTGRERPQIIAREILVNGQSILQPEAHMTPYQGEPVADEDIPF